MYSVEDDPRFAIDLAVYLEPIKSIFDEKHIHFTYFTYTFDRLYGFPY